VSGSSDVLHNTMMAQLFTCLGLHGRSRRTSAAWIDPPQRNQRQHRWLWQRSSSLTTETNSKIIWFREYYFRE